ncbi:MAG: hypothetical protein MJE77_08010 [Proteobacteria bacterium]|nr:hypothetical protein [Pseudomonadota bacterium]
MTRNSAHSIVTGLIITGLLGVLADCTSGGTTCGEGTSLANGQCIPVVDSITCGPGTVLAGAQCVPDDSVICESGTVLNPDTATCVVDPATCGSDAVLVGNRCRDPADVVADVDECGEPNAGPGSCSLNLPATDADTTLSGCIQPLVDELTGLDVPDYDSYLFEIANPTLLEVTVDGHGGLVGGFTVQSLDDQLQRHHWTRIGTTLIGDLAQRQVYLPRAGHYRLTITDSRTLMGPDFAAGSADACYLATIRTIDIPLATEITDERIAGHTGDGLYQYDGLLDGTAGFYRFTAVTEGTVLISRATANSQLAHIDIVVLENGEYVASSASAERPMGEPASISVAGLKRSDQLIFVVEPVHTHTITPLPYHLTFTAPAVVALPTRAGVAVSLDVPQTPQINPYRLAYFDVGAGDVVGFDLDLDAGATRALVHILDSALQVVSLPCSEECSSYRGFVYFLAAGRYYLAVADAQDASGNSLELNVNAYDRMQPEAIAVNTPRSGISLGKAGADFFRLDPHGIEWWLFTGSAREGFEGDILLTLFATDRAGQLGSEVESIDSMTLTADKDTGRIVDENRSILVMVQDKDSDSGSGTSGRASGIYDLSITDRDHIDAGVIDHGTSYHRDEISLGADQTRRFLVRAEPFHEVTISARADGLDLTIDQLDRVELATLSKGAGLATPGTATARTSLFEQWVAFRVGASDRAAGSFDVSITAEKLPYRVAADSLPYRDVCSQGQIHQLDPVNGNQGFEGDEAFSAQPIALPFAFDFFASSIPMAQLTVSTNGWLTLAEPRRKSTMFNDPIPDDQEPDSLIAPLWDDLNNVEVCVLVEPERVTVQWTGCHYDYSDLSIELQAVLHENGSIDFIYGPDHKLDGAGATIGVENSTGTDGVEIAYEKSDIALPGTSLTLIPTDR